MTRWLRSFRSALRRAIGLYVRCWLHLFHHQIIQSYQHVAWIITPPKRLQTRQQNQYSVSNISWKWLDAKDESNHFTKILYYKTWEDTRLFGGNFVGYLCQISRWRFPSLCECGWSCWRRRSSRPFCCWIARNTGSLRRRPDRKHLVPGRIPSIARRWAHWDISGEWWPELGIPAQQQWRVEATDTGVLLSTRFY